MNVKLKPIEHQVMVLTGASSGIGLTTARMAAKRGTRLVLAARSEDALRQLTEELQGNGGPAVDVVADVSREEDVRRIAQVAQERFGGFDTWVNNAGVSMYGELTEVSVEDMRRLFEINVWGLIYGSREAVAHLRTHGGALINIGSVLSDRAIPLQGIYSASKHAVKGFTDALRMELEHAGAPVSVTLIKPAAIDTPYPHHAKNYLEAEPKHAPPVYAPETVARAILHAAEHPTRDVYVGGGARALALFGSLAPRVTDRVEEAVYIEGSKSQEPPRPREENGLDRPTGTLEERGGYPGFVQEASVYTEAALRPALTRAALVGTGLAALALWRSRGRQS